MKPNSIFKAIVSLFLIIPMLLIVSMLFYFIFSVPEFSDVASESKISLDADPQSNGQYTPGDGIKTQKDPGINLGQTAATEKKRKEPREETDRYSQKQTAAGTALQKIDKEVQDKIKKSPNEVISVLIKPEDYKEELEGERPATGSIPNKKLVDELNIQLKVEKAAGEVKLKTKSYIEVDITAKNLNEIVSEDAIEKIYANRPYSVVLDKSTDAINAPLFWNNGYNGDGIKIAVLDTGLDTSHAMLSGKVVGEEAFTGENHTFDAIGHGTQVAGIAAGKDGNGFSGVAPGALLMNAKVLDDKGSGTTVSIIAGIEWAVDPDNNPDTDDGADIIIMSLGAAYSDPDTPLKEAIDYAASNGVVTVVSSGNCGGNCPNAGCGSFTGVTTPGNVESAITVGAVDDNKNAACFSSGQDFGSYIKPDVVAPGVDIITSDLGGGYKTVSGTSMSAPHVAGVAALLLQKDPTLTHYDIKNLLEGNAVDLGEHGKDIIYGSGFVDAGALLADWQDNETTELNESINGEINLSLGGLINQDIANFKFADIKDVPIPKANSLSDKLAVYSNENQTVYVEAIIFDNAFDLADYLYKNIPLTSEEELNFVTYAYSYIEHNDEIVWYNDKSAYVVKNPHKLDIGGLLDAYSAETSNHVANNFQDNIGSLKELDKESVRIISLRNAQTPSNPEKAEVYSPSWGGSSPSNADNIDFNKDYSETFWTEKANNWYYTSTARRGTLTFGIRDIDSGDDLDLYVYDYLAEDLLCSSDNSGNADDVCTVEKNSDITWGFYILVYPYKLDGNYGEANIYTAAEDCDEKWLDVYDCSSDDKVIRKWQYRDCTTEMLEYVDCDAYDTTTWSNAACYSGDIKKKGTAYDYSCSSGSCAYSTSTVYDTVQSCSYGCSGSSCYECTSDSHCSSGEKCSNNQCVEITCDDYPDTKGSCIALSNTYCDGGSSGDPYQCKDLGPVWCYQKIDTCQDSEYCEDPITGGAQCFSYQCLVTSSSWNTENAVDGNSVTLTAVGNYCSGKSAKFEIWESDCPGFDIGSIKTDDLEEQDMVIQQLGGQTGSDNFSAQNIKDYCIGSHLVNTISSVGFSSNKFQAPWTAKYEDDVIGNPDYYFNVIVDGNELSSSSNYLRVSEKCTDNDGDGYGNPASNTCAHSELDCRDDNANIHPGKTELCNNVDDDCDNSVDETFNKQTDRNNCGTCGNVCSVSRANEACSSGSCFIASCENNYGNCDNSYSNGCEATLLTDNNNCGSCGNRCNANQLCQSGICTDQASCGDNICQSGENCPKDCLKVDYFANPLSSVNEGQQVAVKVVVKNTGTTTMSEYIETAIVPTSWEGSIIPLSYSPSSVVAPTSKCCSANEYYSALAVELAGGETETLTFTLNAPSKNSINHCGNPVSAWGSSFKLVSGFYEKCGEGYTDYKKTDISVVPSICNTNDYCDEVENNANCPNECICDFDQICDQGETAYSCSTDCGCDTDKKCESLRGEDIFNCPTDCADDCDIPDGSSYYCSCNSDTDCRPFGDYFCNQVSGPDACEKIQWQDECSNYNDFFCESGDVYKCVGVGNHYEKQLIEYCGFGGRYCDASVVDGTGACSQHPNQMDVWVDYANVGSEANKQPGDKLKLNIYTKYPANVDVWYDSNIFEGNCQSSMSLSSGINSCDLTVKTNAGHGNTRIKVDNDNVASVNILDDPSLLILTDSEKLGQRYPHEENGVKAVLKQAYANAKQEEGVVYDLSWYKSELGKTNPFTSLISYVEKIFKPSMVDNSYSLAVSSFVKEKCDLDNDGFGCKDVMIVGDDFVVPYTRIGPTLEKDYFNFFGLINWGTYTKNVYSDSYYITRAFYRTFADMDEIFSRKVKGHLEEEKRVKIIIPPNFNSEQDAALVQLESTLTTKFNPDIERISSTSVACNQVRWLDDMKGSTVIIIGTTQSNPAALNCYPFFIEEQAEHSIAVDINIWDNHENAIIIGSDHPNAILAFEDIINKGIYKDIQAKSFSFVDIGVGIGGGIVLGLGIGAAVAGAPVVAGVAVVGGAVVAGTSFANECVMKNYGGDNWGWCFFDAATTATGAKLAVPLGKALGPISEKLLKPAFRPLLENAGVARAFSFAVKTSSKIILILDDALRTGQLESLGKMLSRLSASEFGNTVKYVNLWEGNAFRNAKSELNLVRVFDSPTIDTVIGEDATKTIRNTAVLREGIQTGDDAVDFGMVHIRVRHIGADATASSKFPISYGDQDVIDLISDGLKYGHKGISNKPEKLVIEYIPKSWNFPMRIVVEEKTGNLISAFPTENMR